MRPALPLLALLLAATPARADTPSPEQRRDWEGTLFLHGSWRGATSTPFGATEAASFGTGLPYLGGTLSADAYPLKGELLRRFGLGLGWTFSTASIDVTFSMSAFSTWVSAAR